MSNITRYTARLAACFVMAFVLAQTAIASSDPELLQKLDGSKGKLAKDSFVVTSDVVYDDVDSRGNINFSKPQIYKNTVVLLLDEYQLGYIPVDSFTYSVTISIEYTDLSGAVTTLPSKVLAINYRKAQGAKFNAREYCNFTGGRRVKVTIVQTTLNTYGDSWSPINIIRLENRMQAFREYNFNCGTDRVSGIGNSKIAQWGTTASFIGNIISGDNHVTGVSSIEGLEAGLIITGNGLQPNTTIIEINGNTLTLSDDAENTNTAVVLEIANDAVKIDWDINTDPSITHYDIEWAWVDETAQENYQITAPDGSKIFSDKLVFANNASRVTIANAFPGGQKPNYSIPLLYDGSGTLLYRARPMQQQNDGKILLGAWSDLTDIGNGYLDFDGHQPNLNWQATTTYAEDGKRKSVVQYFDATLRNRQTVTKDNSTNTTVVAETFYDYQGRPAIQVLPAPTLSSIIKYAEDFNRFTLAGANSNQKDVYDIINGSSGICGSRTGQLSTTSGAAQYYSAANPKANEGENKYIPDAGGYPYTETSYAQDATGRVAAQGGVGGVFQLKPDAGNSNHSTQYFYGSPTQKELDALFGSEVGHASHYFKNMVKDANGQYSVSYVDMAGRTVATALAGQNPGSTISNPGGSLAPLASLTALRNATGNLITEDLLAKQNNLVQDRTIISTTTLLVPQNDNYTFTYTLNPESAEIKACNIATGEEEETAVTICYDCLYDLEITLVPPCNGTPITIINENNFSLNPATNLIDNLDVKCSAPARGFSVSSTQSLNVPGEYTIIKKLTLSRQAQNWYKQEVFIPSNTCQTLNNFYNVIYEAMLAESNCNPNCSTCNAALGTYEDFRANFLTNIGLDPLQNESSPIKAAIKASFNENKAACDLLCDAPVSKTDNLREQLIADMTPPNGQYARTNKEDGDAIILYQSYPFNIYKMNGAVVPFLNPRIETPFEPVGDTYNNEFGLLDEGAYNINNYGYPDGLKYTIPEYFEHNFENSWVNSLLYHHPEYHRYKLLKTTLKTSTEQDFVLENISSYTQAELLGYMRSGTHEESDMPGVVVYDNQLLATDNFFNTVGSEWREEMRLAMESNYFKYANEFMPPAALPPYELSMWQIAWTRLNCPNNDETCILNSPKVPVTPASSTCNGDKNNLWLMFRTMYLSLKKEYVMLYLESAAPISGFDNIIRTSAYGYSRRIGSFSDFQLDNQFLNAVNGTTATGSDGSPVVPPVIVDQQHDFYASNCEAYKQLWIQDLGVCLNQQPALPATTKQAIIDQLLPLLKDICIAGSDDKHPFGSSTRKPTDGQDPNSFEDALNTVLTNNGVSRSALCHPFLISYPKEYNKQQPPSDGVAVVQKDACLCTKLENILNQRAADNYSGTISGYILYRYGVFIRQSLLDTLISGCNGSTACTMYEAPIAIPGFLTCFGTTSETCIDCKEYKTKLVDFHAAFPSISADAPYETPNSPAQVDANEAFESFMNYRTGFSKSWGEYIEFGKECNSYIALYSCSYLDGIVAEFNSLNPTVSDVNACHDLFVAFFNQKTGRVYNWDGILAVFLSSCGTPPNVCKITIICADLYQVIANFKIFYYGPSGIGLPRNDCEQAFTDYFNNRFKTIYLWKDLVKLFFDECRITLQVCEPFNCADIKVLVAAFKQTQPWMYPDCKERWVTFFNQHYGTDYDWEKIEEICKKCVKSFNVCDPDFDCKKFELYIAQYKEGLFECTSITPKGSPQHCRDCFTQYINQKMGKSYSYEQILLLAKRVCGMSLKLCDDVYKCETLTGFVKDFTNSVDPNSANCRNDFVAAFNAKFKVHYTYEQIMAVYLYYCKEMPSPCNKIKIETCEQIAQVYGNFIAPIREGEPGSPGSGLPNLCQSAFTDFFNTAFGSHYLFSEIMALYQELCPKLEVVLCDPRFCEPYNNFLANHLANFGSYQWPQQLKKDFFVLVFNQEFAPEMGRNLTWGEIYNLYSSCNFAMFQQVAPEDSGPLLDCNRLEGIEYAIGAIRSGEMPEDCKAFVEDKFQFYFQTDMTYAEMVAWGVGCHKNLDFCKGFVPPTRRVILNKARVISINIGSVQPPPPPMPPRLCGLSTPAYPSVAEPPPGTCAEVRALALNAATEQYSLYVQHMADSFDITYQHKCLGAASIERLTVSHKPAEYHYTLYYYDQAGNLVKTVPPEGVHPDFSDTYTSHVKAARDGTLASDEPLPLPPAHTLATQYRYNTLNQLVMQQTPDAGISKFWYDRLGRLAASQNAKQQPHNQYSYTLYDKLGRVTEVGQLSQTAAQAMEALQTICQNGDNETVSGSLANWLANKPAVEIIRTGYDAPYADNTLCVQQYLCQQNLRNRVSYASLHPAGTPGGISVQPDHSAATYYSYDLHGNVDVLLQDINQGYMKYKDLTLTGSALNDVANLSGNRFKKIEYDYDLISGKVNEVAYQKDKADAFYHRYSYDAENKITDVETSRDKVYWEHDAEYKYYKHGPLARTVLGELKVQGLDYAYTLQGWLKGINSTSVGDASHDMGGDGKLTGNNSLVGRDVFGFSLNYFNSDYQTINSSVTPFASITTLPAGGKDLFNGNISSLIVNLPTLEAGRNDAAKIYGFGYDQLNRLLNMDVYEGLNNASNIFTPITINNQYKEQLKYDANGNILEYKRNGNGSSVFLNNYQYNYTAGTNRLASINKRDAAGATTANKTYNYDEIGNTIFDEMQGVTNAVWNVYGKLQSCTNKIGQAITYTYGADGQRLSKTVGGSIEYYVRDATGNTMATYKKDAAVNNNALTVSSFDKYGSSYLGTLKANVDLDAWVAGGTTPVVRGVTEYLVADHRSNSMLTVSDKKIAHDDDHNGSIDYYTADVLTASYYSAYGAISKSFNGSEITKAHNGQKRSQEIGEFAQTALFWEYNSDVGRRWNVDPKIKPWESSYMCFSGNPILMTDILGDEAFDKGKKKKNKKSTPTQPAATSKPKRNNIPRIEEFNSRENITKRSEPSTHKYFQPVIPSGGLRVSETPAAPPNQQPVAIPNPNQLIHRNPGLSWQNNGGAIISPYAYNPPKKKPNQTAIKILETGSDVTDKAELAFKVLGKSEAADYMGKVNGAFTYASVANNALSGNSEGLAKDLLDIGISKTPLAPYVYSAKILHEVFFGNQTMANAYISWDDEKKILINNYNYYQQQKDEDMMDNVREKLITIEKGQKYILETLQKRAQSDN